MSESPLRAAPRPAPDATDAPEDDGRRARWLGLAGGALAVMAVHLIGAWGSTSPRIVADEAAYLGMARLLGGGPRWNLHIATTYGSGYSVLLAPWYALDLSPTGVYRAAIGTNVALAGATFVACEAFARRVTTLVSPVSVAVSAVAVSLPALSLTTGVAWSDNLTPLCVLLLLLATLRLVDRPTVGTGVLTGAVWVAGVAAHARLLPLAAIVVVVLGVRLVQRRTTLVAVASTVGVMTLGYLGVKWASGELYDRLYVPGGQVDQGLAEADRLTHLNPLAFSGIGQTWYLLVATAGVAGFAGFNLAATGWRAARRRGVGRPRQPTATRATGVGRDGLQALPLLALTVVIATLVLSFSTSVGFMTDRPRTDHLVYGRYNDAFIAPLVVIGLATLIARPGLRWLLGRALALAATMAVTSVLLSRYRRWVLGYATITDFGVLGLVPYDLVAPRRLLWVTAVAVGLLALVTLAASLRRGRTAAVVGLAAVLVVGGTVRGAALLDADGVTDPSTSEELEDVVAAGEVLTFVNTPTFNSVGPFYRFQLYLPDNPAVLSDQPAWDTGTPLVLADAREPAVAQAGYRLAWVDPESQIGLWVAPGPRQDELAEEGRLVAPPAAGSPGPAGGGG